MQQSQSERPRFREAISRRLHDLGRTRQWLAEVTGLSPSYVYKLLWNGPGARKRPSSDTLRRVAGALDLDVADLDEAPDLPDYLRDRLEAHPPQGDMPVDRLRHVVRLMRLDVRWADWARLAGALGINRGLLESIVSGQAEPSAHVVRQLARATGLGVRWWLRGRMPPDPALVDRVCRMEDAALYLQAIETAARAGLSARKLMALVRVHTDDEGGA